MPSGNALSSRAVTGMYFEALKARTRAAWVSKLMTFIPSNQETETLAIAADAPGLIEWAGERLWSGQKVFTIDSKNKRYGAGIEIPCDWVRRDKTGQIRMRVNELVGRTVQHWSKLGAAVITGGEALLCYDGKYLFAANHTEGESGTQKNLVTYSDVAKLSVVSDAAPTPAEAGQALLGLIAYMMGYKDYAGEPAMEGAASFHIMAPPNQVGAALLQAVSQDNLAAASGAVLASPLKGAFSVTGEMSPWLASWTTSFVIARTDGDVNALAATDEYESGLQVVAEGSEEETKNDRWLFGVKVNRRVIPGMWRHIAKAAFHTT